MGKRIELVSTAIQSVEYDSKKKTLDVLFHDGSSELYLNVPDHVYGDLISTGSPGAFFNNHIRNVYSHK